jgi:hypothetical protein
MSCRNLTQFLVNGTKSGAEYFFACICGHSVRMLDGVRWAYYALTLPAYGLFGLGLLVSGLYLLARTIDVGWGGNDPAMVVIVLVLFIGGGGGLTYLLAGVARDLIRDMFAASRAARFRR